MQASEPPVRIPKKKSAPVTGQPSLPADDMVALRTFVYFALGDGHLSSWEENFLNSMKHRLYQQAVWMSAKEQLILQQIKDKLHYDRPDDPLPPIDPDGIEDDTDADGWPVERQQADGFGDDDDLPDWLT